MKPRKRQIYPQFGFTLIELMMAVAIIIILSGGSLTAYLNFNKSQSMDNDARSLAAEIYRVRTLAASLQYPPGCSSLKGYILQSALIGSDLAGVSLTVDCDPSDVVVPPIKILAGSKFVTPMNLTFLPGSGYLQSGVEQDIVIDDLRDDTVTKTVTVGVYGTVTNK